MPQFCVKQPNDKYANFSTIVDDFTIVDMTRDEAVAEYKSRGMTDDDAEAKVRRADDEDMTPVDFTTAKGSPLTRWYDCLTTIALVHGKEVSQKRARMEWE